MLVRTTPIKIIKNAKDWPSEYSCNFLEPGLVSYVDVDAGIAMLRKETILQMLPSFIGKPVIIDHIDVTPKDFEDHAVGYITKVWYDDYRNWAFCSFILKDDKAKEKVARGYSVSCAYDVLSTAKGGEWHAIKYDEEITGGSGTHLALVTSPRYEGATIQECRMLVNSKKAKITNPEIFVMLNNKQREDTMIKLYRKENVKAGAVVDPKEPTKQKWNGDNLFVKVDNEFVSLADLAKHAPKKNSFVELQTVENDIEINGVVHNVNDLVEGYKASKKNSDEEKDKEEDDKEKKAKKAAKKNEDEKEEKDNGDQDQEEEQIKKQNAEDEDEEKKNSDDEEDEKEEKEVKKNDKKNKEYFVKMNNLRENGQNSGVSVTIDTMTSRVERGVNRYGSGKK